MEQKLDAYKFDKNSALGKDKRAATISCGHALPVPGTTHLNQMPTEHPKQ
jgi:hypothetical protein